MAHNGVTYRSHAMVVVSTSEQWLSLKSLRQDKSGDKNLKLTFNSVGSHQVCDVTADRRSISLHYAESKPDASEKDISEALEGCFKSCKDGVSTFLLLIQGGQYTKGERRMIKVLQAHFGAEALKYLAVLSLEDGTVADTADDSLLELISLCEGRYCRITSSAAAGDLCTLLEMVDFMLTENSVTGYTDAMLAEARVRNNEDSAMKVLRVKVQEVEERRRAFEELVKQHEERRAREVEELRAKHAKERRKEAEEKQQHEEKRESLEEAVISHRAMLQLQMSPKAAADDPKKLSVVLLGLSGSGKSSALNLILERAGNQYPVNGCSLDPQPTVWCERHEVFATGRRLILVDTPELWDEDGQENLELVKDCLALSLPGPHVFLLVLQVGRFTQGECEMLGQLQRILGRDFTDHTLVLLVHAGEGQRLRPWSINDYVSGAHATLQGLIRKCGSRFHELNISKSQNALSFPQVKELLAGINKLVASHGGRPYSVKRFSVQELQERKKTIQERKEGALEVNSLLRDV